MPAGSGVVQHTGRACASTGNGTVAPPVRGMNFAHFLRSEGVGRRQAGGSSDSSGVGRRAVSSPTQPGTGTFRFRDLEPLCSRVSAPEAEQRAPVRWRSVYVHRRDECRLWHATNGGGPCGARSHPVRMGFPVSGSGLGATRDGRHCRRPGVRWHDAGATDGSRRHPADVVRVWRNHARRILRWWAIDPTRSVPGLDMPNRAYPSVQQGQQ